MTTKTSNLGLKLVNFNIVPWHDDTNDNWRILDAAVATATGVSGLEGAWENGIDVIVGQKYLDVETLTAWEVLVSHTTPQTGTFEDARTAQPTYWQGIGAGLRFRGEWATATEYVANDLAFDSNEALYGVCLIAHTSTTSMRDDIANWGILADASTNGFEDALALALPTTLLSYFNTLPVTTDGISMIPGLNRDGDVVISASPAEMLRAAGDESTDPGYSGRWSDIDPIPPKSLRIRDRVFIGAGCETDDTRLSGAIHQTDWYPYANWAPRDSDVVVMSTFGGYALTGMTRTSDKYTITPSSIPPSAGVGAFLINNYASAFGRALYVDVQRESGAGGSIGIEAACKNLGTDINTTAYNASGDGVIGSWFAAGGDPVYGGVAANPCNVAVHVKNGVNTTINYRWNRGLVFSATALTGTDGSAADTGTGVAIEMAKQHQIQWKRPNDVVGAFIKSLVGNTGLGGGLRFEPSNTYITDGSGTPIARFDPVASAVNYPALVPAIAGGAVDIQAQGADTNISIKLSGKGTGGIRYTSDVSVNPAGSSLSGASSGRVFTNEGATGLATFNLPTATVGQCFDFIVMDTDGVRVVAAAGDVIHVAASVSAVAGRIDNAVIGSAISLVAVNATDWIATSVVGTWSVT